MKRLKLRLDTFGYLWRRNGRCYGQISNQKVVRWA